VQITARATMAVCTAHSHYVTGEQICPSQPKTKAFKTTKYMRFARIFW